MGWLKVVNPTSGPEAIPAPTFPMDGTGASPYSDYYLLGGASPTPPAAPSGLVPDRADKDPADRAEGAGPWHGSCPPLTPSFRHQTPSFRHQTPSFRHQTTGLPTAEFPTPQDSTAHFRIHHDRGEHFRLSPFGALRPFARAPSRLRSARSGRLPAGAATREVSSRRSGNRVRDFVEPA